MTVIRLQQRKPGLPPSPGSVDRVAELNRQWQCKFDEFLLSLEQFKRDFSIHVAAAVEKAVQPLTARVQELEHERAEHVSTVQDLVKQLQQYRQRDVEKRENDHAVAWPQRKRALIVRNIIREPTAEGSVQRVLKYLNLPQLSFSSAFHVRMPGRDADAVCFEVATTEDAAKLFTADVKKQLSAKGLSAGQQTTQIERKRRRALFAVPAFQKRLQAEASKREGGDGFIQWQLDCCVVGRGDDRVLWTLERAEQAQAELEEADSSCP